MPPWFSLIALFALSVWIRPFAATAVTEPGLTRAPVPKAKVGEVLAVALMLGVILALALPFNAVRRGRQKRTMSDIRSIGTAVESYQVDNGATPDAATIDELGRVIEPAFIKTLPARDAWKNPLLLYSRPDGYVIASPGRDGTFEQDWSECVPGGCEDRAGPTTSFDADILFSDGFFVRYPEGAQR